MSTTSRNRRPRESSQIECAFRITCTERDSTLQRKRPNHNRSSAATPRFDQPYPFAPIGRLNGKSAREALGLQYSILPENAWLGMTQYNSFVLKGSKFLRESFIYVANGQKAQRQGTEVKEEAHNGSTKGRRTSKSGENWVAFILEIRASDEYHVFARVYWMYWPEELPEGTMDGERYPAGRQSYHGRNELIASNHMDIINVARVTSPADVKQWNEENDEEIQEALYWRQALDYRTKQLSSVVWLRPAAWDLHGSREQHLTAKEHVPDIEQGGYGRCLKTQQAVDEHKSVLNSWADLSSTPPRGSMYDSGDSPVDLHFTEQTMQVPFSVAPSGILESMTSEAGIEVGKAKENDMDETAIHMSHLSFDAAAQQQDEILSSPLLTVSLLDASPPSQFGLFGGSLSESCTLSQASRLFYNVTCPSSVLICGSQGSGKSNTLACLLENCIIPSKLGKLPQPLAGIIFHFDSFVSDAGGLPCETAFLASHNQASVRILCSPTNVRTIQSIYNSIPQVKIEPLRLSDQDLNTRRMLDLMAVKEGGVPLYLHVVNRILREMRLEQQEKGQRFNYSSFKEKLEQADLTLAQRGPLSQRLDTLESFMVNSKTKHGKIDWEPKPGQLTIVDLSCPCVTAETACLLFNICLSLFLEQKSCIGRVVALDEVHKYMQESDESNALTNSLLNTIRLQRHLGVRVLISTQEPTVSTKLLDLCSMTVVHRFTSPNWLQTLRGHIAGISSVSVTAPAQQELTEDVSPVVVGGQDSAGELFAKIVSLQTGQALVFAPGAVIGLRRKKPEAVATVQRLAHRPLLVKIRSRLTQDGGKTVMN
ncbi:Putative BAH domain, P-loop containing nucleoside triphosphate hydrolase [Colletotrichum destructivum]|uniref:BAH domain, P-loop containing nucleoside triphosphate hydrolase n=1 Tax=Colletotrichum destructivum TaxID=34406 RepID=A0AAX4J4N9_9PEZI|nr:Putative BAH domain, P-loop containing nucleoside triphosphate hydrolase [Colletotrichum destructivum]